MKKTGFSEYLVRCNGLDELGFEEWLFHPGMLFGALDRWWADGGNRAKPHEGLDLCLYRGLGGHNRSLDERTKIPLTYDGEIVKIDDDFLGRKGL
ncbi:MAG: hypothetical protein HWN68_12100 [Desulfobacterales bacterium]|nr:hypothetical protein [Desulfobacterales bacterium]